MADNRMARSADNENAALPCVGESGVCVNTEGYRRAYNPYCAQPVKGCGVTFGLL
jgi:hypothetical protein